MARLAVIMCSINFILNITSYEPAKTNNVHESQDCRQSFVKGGSNVGARARKKKKFMTVSMNMISVVVTTSSSIFL